MSDRLLYGNDSAALYAVDETKTNNHDQSIVSIKSSRLQNPSVRVPLRTFQRLIAGNNDVSLIQVSAKQGVSTDQIKLDLQQVLRVRRHLSAHEEDNVNVMDMKEIATMLSGATETLTGLLARPRAWTRSKHYGTNNRRRRPT